MNTYFALDGSYGDAAELLIVDTSMWDEADWEQIHNATDNQRSEIVQSIIDHYRTKRAY